MEDYKTENRMHVDIKYKCEMRKWWQPQFQLHLKFINSTITKSCGRQTWVSQHICCTVLCSSSENAAMYENYNVPVSVYKCLSDKRCARKEDRGIRK